MNYIEIEKDRIPYEFEMEFNGKIYQFEILYNTYGDYFTINLYHNHKPVIIGEKIVLHQPLFDGLEHLDIPMTIVIPYDTTDEALRITYENLNEDVFLYVLD
jgi:hypothetical protein|nr:MAG TPA: hypothetical protein [Caudoviricetes sp.]